MGQKKILFIDDDEDVQLSIAMHLEHISKIDIVCVGSAEEGLARLEADEQYDCVLLDNRMPGMDGKAFLGAYKGHIPIVFSSAYGELTDSRIIASFPKPCDAVEMGKFINQLPTRSDSADDQSARETGTSEAKEEDPRS